MTTEIPGMNPFQSVGRRDLLSDSNNRHDTVDTPARVEVRPELSKARCAYLTLLGEEGCDIVRAYLQQRLYDREKLTGNSPRNPLYTSPEHAASLASTSSRLHSKKAPL